jgi:putative redox protein
MPAGPHIGGLFYAVWSNLIMEEVRLTWLKGRQFIGVDGSRHSIVVSAQQPGDRIGMKPTDLLLISLASCTAVDVVEILKKKRQNIEALEIEVEGQQDEEPPWAFRHIHLKYRIRGGDMSAAAVEKAIELAESKYCSVSASLRPQVAITTSFEIEGS